VDLGLVEPRHRREQRARVGMLRPVENVVDRAGFLLLAAVHHQHAVAQPGDHAEIVRDQDDRGAEIAAHLAHQLQDLRLHGHVERGGRLVGDQEVRAAQHGRGDHHPLAHAAGELVRVHVHALRRLGDVHRIEQLDAALRALCG
jgi:hypothetical protein